MKKTLITALLPISFLMSANVFSQTPNKENTLNRCEKQNEKTVVNIQTDEAGYTVNNQYTSHTLNRKSNSNLAGDFVVGLTSLRSKTVIDFDGNVWQDLPSKGECFAAQINIKLIYEPIEVFIGSEFVKDGCTYNTILEHEMQHVKLYQVNLPTIKFILSELMEKRFGGKPIYAPTGEAKNNLNREIDELWRPLIKSEFAKVQIEQNRLDSEKEINKLTWSCLGEIQSMFGFRYR
ncbi:MAG: hypothetical protein K2P84_07715 [Undibacterium sp.]|nr:hypothetical protein [Undibacterium sp.]